jgi:Ni/Fe-hydrogenase subunit HybB-like protein
MPATMFSWALFAFFVGGAIGGWIVVFALGQEIVQRYKVKKRRRY